MSWEKHWNEIEYIIKSFTCNKDYNIILSLHPRCNQHLYEKKLAYLNIPIASRTTKKFNCQYLIILHVNGPGPQHGEFC